MAYRLRDSDGDILIPDVLGARDESETLVATPIMIDNDGDVVMVSMG